MCRRLRIIVFFLAMCPVFTYAQPCLDCEEPDDPPPVGPIDGGVSFLIGAGALYAVKKFRDQNKSD